VWALQKHETLKMIEQELQQRCSRQGKKYNSVLSSQR
jgi:radical SAM superfamily enzyme